MSVNGLITPVAGNRVTSDVIGAPTLWLSPEDGPNVDIAGIAVPFLSDPTDQNGPSYAVDSRTPAGSIADLCVFVNAGGLAQPVLIPWVSGSPGVAYASYYGAPHNAASVIGLTDAGGTQLLAPYAARRIGGVFFDQQGKLTCHTSFGQNRMWSIWNEAPERQRRIKLEAGSTAENQYVTNMPTYPGWNVPGGVPNPGWAPLNLDPNNSLTVFRGRAGEKTPLRYKQVGRVQAASAGGAELYSSIGWGASNVPPVGCHWGQWNVECLSPTSPLAEGHTEYSEYDAPANFQGAQVAYMLAAQQGFGGGMWMGEHESRMTAEWDG